MPRAVAGLWRHVKRAGCLAITTWGADTFEPANSAFWEAVRQEAPELHKALNPWNRIATPEGLSAIFEAAGVPDVVITSETGSHPLRSVEDWWTIVMGSGFRGKSRNSPRRLVSACARIRSPLLKPPTSRT